MRGTSVLALRSPTVGPSSTAARPRSKQVVGVATLAAAYYGAAKLGYTLEFAGPVGAIVWLPVGIGMAFLSLGGLALWPGVLIGDLFANEYSTLPAGTALVQTCGNMLEVVVAAALIRRFMRQGPPLDSLGGVAKVLSAIAAGTALSATVGSLANAIGGVVSISSLPEVWRTWWLADSCGALVLVPLGLAWAQRAGTRFPRARLAEGGIVIVVIAALSVLALRNSPPLTYIVFPALLWAGIRFGQLGATFAVAVTTGFTIYATTHHLGPYTFRSVSDAVLLTQLYIAVAATTTLALAAVVAERKALAERLRASRARLVQAADGERRRLEHNLHDGAQQRLLALSARLGLASQRPQSAAEVQAFLADAEAELGAAIDELRELAHGIHPTILREKGLAYAVRALAARSTTPVNVIELPDTPLPAPAEVTAYYVIAEALTNAQRHARATSIDLRVVCARSILSAEVADDGVGGAREGGGYGLAGLRDRVEAVGGSFCVAASAERGTRVTARIPMDLPADAREF